MGRGVLDPLATEGSSRWVMLDMTDIYILVTRLDSINVDRGTEGKSNCFKGLKL